MFKSHFTEKVHFSDQRQSSVSELLRCSNVCTFLPRSLYTPLWKRAALCTAVSVQSSDGGTPERERKRATFRARKRGRSLRFGTGKRPRLFSHGSGYVGRLPRFSGYWLCASVEKFWRSERASYSRNVLLRCFVRAICFAALPDALSATQVVEENITWQFFFSFLIYPLSAEKSGNIYILNLQRVELCVALVFNSYLWKAICLKLRESKNVKWKSRTVSKIRNQNL